MAGDRNAPPCGPVPLGRPALVAALRAAIRARGPLPFATFMDVALYHPRHGYYHTLRAPPGPRGDFYTSPEAHGAFGALVARQALEVWERLGQPRPFVIEEWGAGSGRLAADVLTAAAALAPAWAGTIEYALVERSAALRRAQRRLLSPWGAQVRWPRPAARGQTAPHLVLANELLDAFGVHRVVWRAGTLHEVYVDAADDGFRTVEGPPSTPALAAYFARLGLRPPEGAIAEVNLAALAWLRALAPRLVQGAVLLFDYGHPAEVLYSARYPMGTLRTCYRHGPGAAPTVLVGYQDLTAHVDVTSVLLEGRAAGLTPLGVARQRDFLRRLGLATYEEAVRTAGLPAATARASLAGLAALARPGGLGDYWVIGFGRGIAGPLHGLREDAAPLREAPVRALLGPRLGWGDAGTPSVPRQGAGAGRGQVRAETYGP